MLKIERFALLLTLCALITVSIGFYRQRAENERLRINLAAKASDDEYCEAAVREAYRLPNPFGFPMLYPPTPAEMIEGWYDRAVLAERNAETLSKENRRLYDEVADLKGRLSDIERGAGISGGTPQPAMVQGYGILCPVRKNPPVLFYNMKWSPDAPLGQRTETK